MAATTPSSVAAILVAAGEGVRLGAGIPKAFIEVRGRTLLEHALSRFVAHDSIGHIVVVAPPTSLSEAAVLCGSTATVVAGGATRQESVGLGLATVGDEIESVLVHDVARPFVPPEVVDRVCDALAAGADAAIPARPVVDTIKRVDAAGTVVETVDRAQLWAVQTPQGFRRSVLVAAHAAALSAGRADASDDARLVEALGGKVVIVDGADEAFKITRPWDLVLAEAVAGG